MRYAAGESAYCIGGGAKSKLWRRILSDALDLTLVIAGHSDSSFGSAMCAGIAAGFFKDFDGAAACCCRETARTEPIKENVRKYAELYERYKKISGFHEMISHEK